MRARLQRGVLALGVRQVVAHGATYASTLVLARWLAPELFGLFVAAGPLMIAVASLTDLGAGAALVQRPEAPSRGDLCAAFTLVLGVSVALAAVAAASAPLWVARAGLPGEYVPPLIALSALFCFFPLRSVPLLLLERDLEFPAVALVETTGAVAYQAVLVAALAAGAGAWSLGLATATRLLVELVLLWRRRPFRPGLAKELGELWAALRRGFRYQVVRGLGVVKDNLPALLVAPLLGASAFGYLQWAIVYAGMPVYLTSLVSRLAFPAVARLQADRAAVGRTLEATLRLTASIGLPGSAMLLLWSRELVPLLYGPRWLTALPLVGALTANMAVGVVMGTLMSAFNGLGRVAESARVVTWWTVLTYALSFAAIRAGRGATGVAWAYSVSTVVMLFAAYRPLGRELGLRARAIWTMPVVVSATVVAIGLLARASGRAAWPALVAAGLLSSAGVWAAAQAGRRAPA